MFLCSKKNVEVLNKCFKFVYYYESGSNIFTIFVNFYLIKKKIQFRNI